MPIALERPDRPAPPPPGREARVFESLKAGASGACLRGHGDPAPACADLSPRRKAAGTSDIPIPRLVALLCLAPLCAIAPSSPAQDAAAGTSARGDDATTLEPVRVVAPRMDDLYRSRPPERTPPTVFDRAWREPVNLKKIGDQGGVIPLLVNYAARKLAEGARKLPGWKGPDQPAIARPPPLDERQMDRAQQLQQELGQQQ